jgi:hypothetical protein
MFTPGQILLLAVIAPLLWFEQLVAHLLGF